ncbi:MAG: hypothetical protein IJH12_04915 [Clostridia bacterium]|nr:hypothetical protein [Clostridia bacterium]
MEEFNTIEKVQELFASIDALGNNNLFFVACQDKQKVSGVVAGMEYPYDGLLINATENGIAMFYLKAGALSGLFTLSKPSKMTLDKENHIFIPTNNIKGIKIKNFALLNSKTKRIEINTLDGKSHKLYANVVENDFPYHNENFARFMEKYGK